MSSASVYHQFSPSSHGPSPSSLFSSSGHYSDSSLRTPQLAAHPVHRRSISSSYSHKDATHEDGGRQQSRSGSANNFPHHSTTTTTVAASEYRNETANHRKRNDHRAQSSTIENSTNTNNHRHYPNRSRPENHSQSVVVAARPTHVRRTPSPSQAIANDYPEDPVVARLLRRFVRKAQHVHSPYIYIV